MISEMKTIAVVGGGQMGSGIAQLTAMHGCDAWLLDTDPSALTRASKSISSSIQRLVSKGQLTQVNKYLSLILYMLNNLMNSKPRQFVIEIVMGQL